MKKLIFASLFFIALSSYGQFTKGTRTVGLSIGSLGFSNFQQTFDYGSGGTFSDINNTLNISINPSMGKFISDVLLVGGGVTINFSNSKYDGGTKNNTGNTLTAGVNGFGRYYFGTTGFMPYGQVSLGAGFGSGKRDGDEKGTYTSGQTYSSKYSEKFDGIFDITAGAGVGLTKLVTKNIGLDLGLTYQFNRRSYKYSSVNDLVFTNPTGGEQRKGNNKYTGTSNNVQFSVGFLIFLDSK